MVRWGIDRMWDWSSNTTEFLDDSLLRNKPLALLGIHGMFLRFYSLMAAHFVVIEEILGWESGRLLVQPECIPVRFEFSDFLFCKSRVLRFGFCAMKFLADIAWYRSDRIFPKNLIKINDIYTQLHT